VRVVLKAVAQLQECGVLMRTMAESPSEAIASARFTSGIMSALPSKDAKGATRTPPGKRRGRG
jgi:hypothetical protein